MPCPRRLDNGVGDVPIAPSFYSLDDDESAPCMVGVPTASRKWGLRGPVEKEALLDRLNHVVGLPTAATISEPL